MSKFRYMVFAVVLVGATIFSFAKTTVSKAWATKPSASADCNGISWEFVNTEPKPTDGDTHRFDMVVVIRDSYSKKDVAGPFVVLPGDSVDGSFPQKGNKPGGNMYFELTWVTHSGTDLKTAFYNTVAGCGTSTKPPTNNLVTFDKRITCEQLGDGWANLPYTLRSSDGNLSISGVAESYSNGKQGKISIQFSSVFFGKDLLLVLVNVGQVGIWHVPTRETARPGVNWCMLDGGTPKLDLNKIPVVIPPPTCDYTWGFHIYLDWTATLNVGCDPDFLFNGKAYHLPAGKSHFKLTGHGVLKIELPGHGTPLYYRVNNGDGPVAVTLTD